ncbi:SDR family oxidoreductase [Streptomyces sp. NPDC094438]|uniref:SDR family oxidoreductase n=1 Tax=Streptomyces sp. NPDC094438 TaxID=3366061 RepID=UPI0037FA7629
MTRDVLRPRRAENDFAAVVDTNLTAVLRVARTPGREFGTRNVTAIAVPPGDTETVMTASLADQQHEYIRSQIPVGRAARPEQIASAGCFLASGRAAFITGAVVLIDGRGYVISRCPAAAHQHCRRGPRCVSLCDVRAPIDRQGGAGDVGRRVGDEEDQSRSELLGLPDAA